jgi:small neutral amino acid transporter SnatA (MarC family)
MFSQQEIIVSIESAVFLVVLLNPFLLSIYLLDLVEKLSFAHLGRVLFRASLISGVVFCAFAWAGDSLLTRVLHVRFASFMIFGGVVFLVIGVRFVLLGGEALDSLRGQAEHVAGSVAMPFMIGPGTVSASVIAGTRAPLSLALVSIAGALAATSAIVLAFKLIHDFVKKHNEKLVERYVDIVGRLSALVIGTIAVEMILQGIEKWLDMS